MKYKTRIDAERAFHNERFSENTRSNQDKFYFAIEDGAKYFSSQILKHIQSGTSLEYGCGSGENSIELCQTAQELHSIDISDYAVEKAKELVAVRGIKNLNFYAMNCEMLEFADAKFDVVFGSGILHHLDLDRACAEISRVLNSRGVAIFWEPLGVNPLFNFYRFLTPHARTVDEHPLVPSDFSILSKYFSKISIRYFGLFSLLSVPFRKSRIGVPLRRSLLALDNRLAKIPVIKWFMWFVYIEMSGKELGEQTPT